MSVFVIGYYTNIRPYLEKTDLYLETLNEIVFLGMTYMILMFSDWVPDK
jgi:hypothetical protein